MHPSPFLQGGSVEPPTKFSKRGGGAWHDLNFYRGLLGKRGGLTFFRRGWGGGGCNFHIKNESVTIKK